ncbi:MAG: hypothetical protein KDN19_13865 [Verrucomicrobiae bacterium]|nr:hypothetical protein [Verrucomicrobiae bacterium]
MIPGLPSGAVRTHLPRPAPRLKLAFRLVISGIAVAFSHFEAAAQAPASPEPLAILHRQCLRCHSEEKRKGGLLLTGRENLLAGGDSGPIASPGHSGGSLLIESLFPDAESHMPPKGQLDPDEIAALENWIDEGLPWDEAAWERLQLSVFEEPVNLTALPASYRPIFGVALSPDGKTLAAGRGNRIEWFSIAEPKEEKQDAGKNTWLSPLGSPSDPGPDTIESLAWSPDGSIVASGNFRRISLWDAKSRQKTADITPDFVGRISALAFAPDSKLLLAADSVDATSGRLFFIDPATGKVLRVISAHPDTIFSIAVSPDGRLAATTSADKSVKVWNLSDGTLAHHLEGHTDYVLAAAFSPQTDRLATAGDDEEVKIWRLETGKKVASFGGTRTGAITALAWITDPAKAKLKAEEKDREKAAAINTDRIVALNEAGLPRIYTDLNEHEGEQRSTGAKEKAAEATTIGLTALALDPQSQRFFAGSTEGIITAWDENGKVLIENGKPEPLAQANP